MSMQGTAGLKTLSSLKRTKVRYLMSKHISPSYFYELPSGTKVHPCRLILKDGSLMWKHALLNQNNAAMPVVRSTRTAHNKNCSAPRGTEQLGVSRLRTMELFSSYSLVCTWPAWL